MAEITSGNYSIYINKGISRDLNRFFKAAKNRYSRIFILVDEHSLKFCYPQLVNEVDAFKDAEIIEIESGEESKNIEVCTQIWATLSEYGADRRSLFVNLGGGVIGDMGGFIASTFKRGITYINIPTTLLAQVDASVGGKTGIDLFHLKNEIGLFCTPAAVFADTTFLNTLDRRQLLSGFAEIIKHALIADAGYWEQVKAFDLSELSAIASLITASVTIKNSIVTVDPREQGLRKVLNFGHTIGHALETYSLENDEHKPLLHGEAVAAGMVCEAYLSAELCKLDRAQLGEITQFILQRYEPLKLGRADHVRLLELMKHDKKNDKGDIHFSLLSAIGKCEINKTAKASQIVDALNYYTRESRLI